MVPILVGLVALLAAVLLVLYLIPGKPQMMHVTCVGEDGRATSSEWVRIKPPDLYKVDGMSHVAGYVAELAASDAEFAHLKIFSPDCNRGFSLLKRRGEPITASIIIDWRKHPAKEKRARDFFAALTIQPDLDYLAGNGNVMDATRILHWSIGQDAAFVTEISERILIELCDIKQHEALNITFEEHAARNQASA
jgi:hypothetical protein